MRQIKLIQWIAIWITAGCLGYLPATFAAASDAAVIVNSGSTNFPGFRIAVERSGSAQYTAAPRKPSAPLLKQPETTMPARRTIARELVHRFYADLEAAKPLSALPKPRCAKSASFGSRLTVEFDGDATPDLSCGDADSPRLRALIRDVNEINALFSPK